MTLNLTTRDLDYLSATRYNRFRPSKFRSILRVDHSTPPWADRVEVRTIDMYADFKLINGLDDALPKAQIDATSATQVIREFAAAYDVSTRQIERARKFGLDLDATKSLANQTRSEQLLDAIAAVGDAGAGLFGLTTLPGPVAAVAPPVAVWTVATDPQVILDQMHALRFAVTNASLEGLVADAMALPLPAFQLIATMRLSDGTPETVLTAFQKQAPEIKSIVGWFRLNAAGFGGASRMVAFDSAAPEGPRMVIPEELRDHPPVQKSLGYEIAQTVRTAGVIADADESVRYLDGV